MDPRTEILKRKESTHTKMATQGKIRAPLRNLWRVKMSRELKEAKGTSPSTQRPSPEASRAVQGQIFFRYRLYQCWGPRYWLLNKRKLPDLMDLDLFPPNQPANQISTDRDPALQPGISSLPTVTFIQSSLYLANTCQGIPEARCHAARHMACSGHEFSGLFRCWATGTIKIPSMCAPLCTGGHPSNTVLPETAWRNTILLKNDDLYGLTQRWDQD